MEKHLKGQGGDAEMGETKEVVAANWLGPTDTEWHISWLDGVRLFGSYGPKPRFHIDLLLEDNSAFSSDLVAQNVATIVPSKNRASRRLKKNILAHPWHLH